MTLQRFMFFQPLFVYCFICTIVEKLLIYILAVLAIFYYAIPIFIYWFSICVACLYLFSFAYWFNLHNCGEIIYIYKIYFFFIEFVVTQYFTCHRIDLCPSFVWCYIPSFGINIASIVYLTEGQLYFFSKRGI